MAKRGNRVRRCNRCQRQVQCTNEIGDSQDGRLHRSVPVVRALTALQLQHSHSVQSLQTRSRSMGRITRHAWIITLGVAAAFAPTPNQQRSHPLRASDEPFDVSKLQGKAARLDTRRRQI